jgi:dTDP-4-amino-4,6-dideoxygalactose transaminase
MIPYGRHSINQEDIDSVTSVLQGEWLTTGPHVEEFESAIEKAVGAPAISVTSGTAALHCAYAAIGIKPGDEVITPPITFIATQATAAQLGAKIVFADVLPDFPNIDPAKVEEVITPNTRAIVAVDFAGHPAEMDSLRIIADKYGIYLIEDAAHSLGSQYKGKPVGSLADITTFSFFPTKNMTTGEGGAVASKIPELLERARKFSRQGMVREPTSMVEIPDGPWYQEVQEFGLNYRLPDILCALGSSQLLRLDKFKARRLEIFEIYHELLKDLDGVKLPVSRHYTKPNWHLFPILVPKEIRLDVFNSLRSAGIGVQVNYMPAHWHPVFQHLGHKREEMPISNEFYLSEISLPMHYNLTNAEIDSISREVSKAIQSNRL